MCLLRTLMLTVTLESGEDELAEEKAAAFKKSRNEWFYTLTAWLIKARKLTFTYIECELLHVIIVSHYTVLAAQFV
ncbi:hypothetical protein Bca4012_067607 [Brassica carinata]